MENSTARLFMVLEEKAEAIGLRDVRLCRRHEDEEDERFRQLVEETFQKEKICIRELEDGNACCGIPLKYNGSMFGVLLFTDCAEYIHVSARFAVVTMEMVIEKHFSHYPRKAAETSLQMFLADWLYKELEQQEETFYHNAAIHGIDISVKRIVCLVRFSDDISSTSPISNYLRKGEFALIHDRHMMVIIGLDNNALLERLQRVCNHVEGYRIYVGYAASDIHASYVSAMEALELCDRFPVNGSMVCSHELILERAMMSIMDSASIRSLAEIFEQKDPGGELRKTIKVYFERNGLNNEICQELAIHRNTLLYRLSRIEELTGYDPRSFRKLFVLYCAAMVVER